MTSLTVVLAACSLVTVTSGRSLTATNAGPKGPFRFQDIDQFSNHLPYYGENPSIVSMTPSDDEQRAESVYNNRRAVQRAHEKEFRKQLQKSKSQKVGDSLIERMGTDKQPFQRMITILRKQIRGTDRKVSDFSNIIEGIVRKCSTRPDRWCRKVASVLLDLVHDDENDGIRINTVSRHRGKRSEMESRGIHSDIDRFINLHNRFLKDDFSHMTPDEWDAHQKISQDQQSVTQNVFKELQNLLYKSRHELQDKSKDVQIFKPSTKTTPATLVVRPVIIADISGKKKDFPEDQSFPSNAYTDNRLSVSFSTGNSFIPTAVYNEPIAAEPDRKKDIEKTTSVSKPEIIANIAEETTYQQEDEYFPSNLYTDSRPSVSFDNGYTISPTAVYNEPIAAEPDRKEHSEKTTSVPKHVTIANIAEETSNRQKDEYASSNLFSENRAPVPFSTGDTFSPAVVYNEPIAAEEDLSQLSYGNTKYSEKLSSTKNENPSTDTTKNPSVVNSLFGGGLFLTSGAASNMGSSQASSTRTSSSEPIPTRTNPTPTRITETFPTQDISTKTSSIYTNLNQTTPSEIPSSTLSRRTVRLPVSTSPDHEYVSRTSPTFARTTLSPTSMTVRSTPREVLFRTSVPFTPVPPAQYVDTSDAITHEYHDYVVDYESHIIDPSDPNAALESLLPQKQLKDLSLNSKYYEYYDDGNNPLTVDPNEFEVSYQPMPVSGSPDSSNSEYDDSNYPFYEYFIISEYPEGGSVSNANDRSSLVSLPDAIVQQADSGDESMRRTVVPFHHLESVTKTSPAPLNPTTPVKDTIRYEIVQNENVHGNAQQVPQYMPSIQFTPNIHMPRKPSVEHSFTIPAPIQNPYIHQTTPQLVTKMSINDPYQNVPPTLHHQYSEPLFNKELMLQTEVPVKSPSLLVTTQKVTESPLDSNLFSSVNTLFQQLVTIPAVAQTTESPKSSNTAQLLMTLQKNLEILSKLHQNQENAKETTHGPSVTVAPFNIDNYQNKYDKVDPPKSATLQFSADSNIEEMKQSSLQENPDKSPPRPSLMDILRASMNENADRLNHQTNDFKTITEDNTSATPKPKVPSVSSLFSYIPTASSSNFVKFQQISPVTIETTNRPEENYSVRMASEIPTEKSVSIEPATAAVVPVILASANTSKISTAAPPKDENLVFGIPLSIIESEFRLTSAEKQKYKSGQHLERYNTPSGTKKHVTVINEAGAGSTEPVKPEETTVMAGASQEKNSGGRSSSTNSQSGVVGEGISASILESELRTVSSEESLNLLDVESKIVLDEINNKVQNKFSDRLSQSHIHHKMGSTSKFQIGFFPQLMATLLAPFGATTEASRKSTVSITDTSQSNLHFTSRAYTQSDARPTLQALFNPSTENPRKQNDKENKFWRDDHPKQGPFGKYDGEMNFEAITSVSTNAHDSTIPMVVKESSLSTNNSTSTKDSDELSPEDTGLSTTTNYFLTSQTVDFPWLYEDLPSTDGDSMSLEQMVSEFSEQPSNNVESTTQELKSPTEIDSTTWSGETESELSRQIGTTIPVFEDFDRDISYTITPTSPSLFLTDIVHLTDDVEASATEPPHAMQYEQGYELEGDSISEPESTSSYNLKTDEFSEHDVKTTMTGQMNSPEQTTNSLDDSLMTIVFGYSTEPYESVVTLQQLLHTAETLIAQATSPSYQSGTESDIESPSDKSTEKPQPEATLTTLFLTNSIEKDDVYVATEAMPTNTYEKVTSDTDESPTLPNNFSDDTLTNNVKSSSSTISASSDVTEIAQVESSSSPGRITTYPVTVTTIYTTDQSSSISSDNSNSTTVPLTSTTPTPNESTTSSSITTPIFGTVKRITTSATKLLTTKPSVGTISHPASTLLPQILSLSDHFMNASSAETRPPSILGSLNVLRRSSNTGFAHTAETLAVSRSLCTAASSTDIPRTPSMRYILQKCAMLKLSGLL